MVLNHARNVDARGGTFNNVQRDQHQTNNNNVTTFNRPNIQISLNFSLFGSQTQNHLPPNFCNNLSEPSGHDTISQGRLLVTSSHSSDAVSGIDSGIGLIVQITNLLIDHRDSSNTQRDLAVELKSLHQTLTLTGFAIQEYEDRPLGQSLAHMIAPSIERCCAVLQELFDRVSGTLLGLDLTRISDLWRPVWWGRWDGDELASLKKTLAEIRRLLESFLMALHSYVIIGFHS